MEPVWARLPTSNAPPILVPAPPPMGLALNIGLHTNAGAGRAPSVHGCPAVHESLVWPCLPPPPAPRGRGACGAATSETAAAIAHPTSSGAVRAGRSTGRLRASAGGPGSVKGRAFVGCPGSQGPRRGEAFAPRPAARSHLPPPPPRLRPRPR